MNIMSIQTKSIVITQLYYLANSMEMRKQNVTGELRELYFKLLGEVKAFPLGYINPRFLIPRLRSFN